MPIKNENRLLKIIQRLILALLTYNTFVGKREQESVWSSVTDELGDYLFGRQSNWRYKIQAKLYSKGFINVGSKKRRLEILEANKYGRGILGSNGIIIFKLSKSPDEIDERNMFRTARTHYMSRLKPGDDILGDQVYYFGFSKWKSFRKNYKTLIAFINDEYVAPERRRAENVYFREILMSGGSQGK